MATKEKPKLKMQVNALDRGVPPEATGSAVMDALFGIGGAQINRKDIRSIALCDLVEWSEQPFRPQRPEKFAELVSSMESNGLMMPIVVRQRPADASHAYSYYQILAGHNRVRAAKQLGWETIDTIVVNADDTQATLIMLDTNLAQRDELLPSEKARAYKMRLEAIKRRPGRPKINSAQNEPNFQESDEQINSAQNEPNFLSENSAPQKTKFTRSNEEIAAQVGESRASIQRLIRLNYLIQSLVDAVDEKKLLLGVGVSLSYLPEPEQQIVSEFLLQYPECTLTGSQADDLKRYSSEVGAVDAKTLMRLFGLEQKPATENAVHLPTASTGAATRPAAPAIAIVPQSPKLKISKADQAEIIRLLPSSVDLSKAGAILIEALKLYREHIGDGR